MRKIDPELKLDKRPLHIRVQQHLRSLIKNGTYQPGQQLPAEAELATNLGVSRPTLREALSNLEQRGAITRKHGVGTFVSSYNTLEAGLEVLESLETQARRIGLTTRVTHLEVIERQATDEEREMLRLPQAEGPTQVTCVDRVILVEGEPAAFLRDIVPTVYLRREEIDGRFSGSVLDILLQRGDPEPVTSRTEILTEAACDDLAAKLMTPEGAPLLKFMAQLYGYDDRVLDYSLSYFVPGYFKFHVTRRVGRG